MTGADSSWRYDKDKARAYGARSRRRHWSEAHLLGRLLDGMELGHCLDAPAGDGRLAPALRALGASRWTGLDRSREMLARARGTGGLVCADVARLPFADAAFDTVICFRFLHHLAPQQQRRISAELARTARSNVVASGFHPASTHRLARVLKRRIRGEPKARFETAPAVLDGWLAEHGFVRCRAARQGWLRDLWAGLWVRSG